MITECATRKKCDQALRKFGGVGIFEGDVWLACHAGEETRYRSNEHIDNLKDCDWLEPTPISKGQMGLI